MRTALALALALAGLGTAQGQKVELFGELRASAIGYVGSEGQFGSDGPSTPCGATAPGDGGGYINGTGVLAISAPGYRYRLGLSAGYFGPVCTDSMRRPLGGIDLRGRHRFGERTQLLSGLRANLDVFDRTLDIRTGLYDLQSPNGAPAPTAGTVYLTGQTGLELQHALSRRFGVRAGVGLQTLQLFTDISRLAEFNTLGAMTAADALIEGSWDRGRDRLELPLRYRASHYYPATLARDGGPALVPPAHDGSLRVAWERRLTSLLTLRTDGGLAFAAQPHLCAAAAAGCSIDARAPGIRGAERPPALEVPLGPLATGTFVGEVALRYETLRSFAELAATRSYEPNAWAGALDLVNRVSASAQLRPTQDLLLTGNLLFGHHGHTSPQRLSPATMPPTTSPQNRTLLLFQSSVGLDHVLWGPLAVFAEASAQVFAIRGEPVEEQDVPEERRRRVAGFPSTTSMLDYQSVWRLAFMVGVRVFVRPPEREPSLLQNARSVP